MKSRDRLPNEVATVHPTNLEVAEYSQRVMRDEVQKVEVNAMNRQILPSHCHAVKIDRAVLLHVADVTEYRRTIVTEIARTTIVVIEIAVDVATIDAIDQDEDPVSDYVSNYRNLTAPDHGNLGGRTFKIAHGIIDGWNVISWPFLKEL